MYLEHFAWGGGGERRRNDISFDQLLLHKKIIQQYLIQGRRSKATYNVIGY